MNLKALSIVIAFICAPVLLVAQSAKKLPSGFYNLVDEDTGIKLKLQAVDKFFNVEQTPITTIKHIIATEAKMDKGNGRLIPVVIITMDKAGIDALNESLEHGTGVVPHHIGLVVNNKLLSSARFAVAISGLKLNLSGSKTIEEAQALKAEIDKER